MRMLEDTATGWVVRVDVHHEHPYKLNELTLHLAEGAGAGGEATFSIKRDVWPKVAELMERAWGWTVGPKVTVGLERVDLGNQPTTWEIYHLVERTWE